MSKYLIAHQQDLSRLAFQTKLGSDCTRKYEDQPKRRSYRWRVAGQIDTVEDLPALLAMQAPQLWARRKDIALFILRQFRFTCRYIDDILALGNAIIELMLYVDQNFCGFPGIYPRDLLITAGGQSAVEAFLDMRLSFLPDGVITTHLYDKLREQKSVGIDTADFLALPLLPEHILPAAAI